MNLSPRSLSRPARLREQLWNVVVPVQCVECGRPEQVICASCLSGVARGPHRVLDGASVECATHYGGVVQTALLAAKRRGVSEPLGVLGRLWRPALARQVRKALALSAGGLAERDQPPPLVVAVPPRGGPGSRGFSVPALLLRGAGCRPAPLLEWRRRTSDQIGLGKHERDQNLSGALRVRRGQHASGQRPPVVLVDDVITTGATLREAARALTDDGWRVVARTAFSSADRMPKH